VSAGLVDKPQILCVDDEPRVLDGLKLTLRRHFDVLTEMTPLAALERLERSPAVVAVISDMRMPSMDGATFLNHVAQRWPRVARVLLTGEAGPDHGAELGSTGEFRVLSKPCTPTQLIATLNDLVGRPGKGSRP
jgi:CheY-like chemotaxis protein